MTTSLIPKKSADLLYAVEKEIETVEEAYKKAIVPLEEKQKELRAKLLEGMIKTGIKSIKLDSGDVYVRVPSTKFEVKDEVKAYKWGEQNQCLRLDMTKARKLLTRTIGVPEGFEQIENEHIAIKRNNE